MLFRILLIRGHKELEDPPQNRSQESPPKPRNLKSTTNRPIAPPNRPIAPPNNNEIYDNIERRKAAAILAVRNFVSRRNSIVPPLQERIVPPIQERIIPLPRAVVRRVPIEVNALN
jgi:hypothetical protein